MPERADHLQAPWGVYAPGRVRGGFLKLSRSAGNSPLGRRLALEARRMARLGLRGPLDTEIWGLRLRLFPRGNVSEARLLFMPHLLDTVERRALAGAARPGWVFVDVGANVGSYSYWVASLGLEGVRIVAAEPDPELHATLRFNLESNGLENVTTFAGAVADRSGTRTMEVSRRNRGENVLLKEESGNKPTQAGEPMTPAAPPEENTSTVKALSLTDLLDREGIEGVDALKVDVEGEELGILSAFFQGADPARWPDLLITEWKGTRDAEALAGVLEEAGYRLQEATRLNRIYRRD